MNIRRSWRLWIAPVFIFFLLVVATAPALVQESDAPFSRCATDSEFWSRSGSAEAEVMTQLNQWRFRIGLAPLARNQQLDRIAGQQADYIKEQVPFLHLQDPDFHTDQFGSGIERRVERNGWAAYDNGEFLAGEIAAYYPNVWGAVNFWQSSPVHRDTVQIAGFREAGVYVLCRRGWLLSFVVLGGRPGVLPVTYDPVSRALFMTRDVSFYSDKFIPAFVQMQGADGIRLHQDEWLVWSDVMPLPPYDGEELTVIMTDGITEVRSMVNLLDNRVFPSQPTPLPTMTPTPRPTSTPVQITATPMLPTPIPSPTPMPEHASGYDIVLYYNINSITLVNQASAPLNVLPLAVRSTFPQLERSGSWWGAFYGGDLTRLPDRYCLQAYAGEVFNGPDRRPQTCAMFGSVRGNLRAGERFWLGRQFEVLYYREVVAVCPGVRLTEESRTCAFDIPSNR